MVHTAGVFRGSSDRKHVDHATSDTSGYVNLAWKNSTEQKREKGREEEKPAIGGCAEEVRIFDRFGMADVVTNLNTAAGMSREWKGEILEEKLEDGAVIPLVYEEFRESHEIAALWTLRTVSILIRYLEWSGIYQIGCCEALQPGRHYVPLHQGEELNHPQWSDRRHMPDQLQAYTLAAYDQCCWNHALTPEETLTRGLSWNLMHDEIDSGLNECRRLGVTMTYEAWNCRVHGSTSHRLLSTLTKRGIFDSELHNISRMLTPQSGNVPRLAAAPPLMPQTVRYTRKSDESPTPPRERYHHAGQKPWKEYVPWNPKSNKANTATKAIPSVEITSLQLTEASKLIVDTGSELCHSISNQALGDSPLNKCRLYRHPKTTRYQRERAFLAQGAVVSSVEMSLTLKEVETPSSPLASTICIHHDNDAIKGNKLRRCRSRQIGLRLSGKDPLYLEILAIDNRVEVKAIFELLIGWTNLFTDETLRNIVHPPPEHCSRRINMFSDDLDAIAIQELQNTGTSSLEILTLHNTVLSTVIITYICQKRAVAVGLIFSLMMSIVQQLWSEKWRNITIETLTIYKTELRTADIPALKRCMTLCIDNADPKAIIE
ncbi:hypothetical protein WN48_03308 [Eufriesea mexicana]|uniref:Uncharacterized protein n=1 Tax=Eufriesea mexicana TaxID=516756 RepID=A0A310SAX0_9HYME|nr:hypothetical protein WN48_03308 [Eufriesea mexicana]